MTTLLLLLLAAFATSASATAPAPARVATLLPYVADAVGRLDGPEVVASVRRDMRTPPPPPVLDLGNPHSPSIERLVEAHPTVVVGDRALHGPQRASLERAGAEVVLLDSTSVATTLDGLQSVGDRVGASAGMAAEVKHTRDAVGSMKLAEPVPTLLLFGTPGAFLVVSNGTWLGDLAKQVGLENVGAATEGQERHPGYVQVSDEVLVGLQPELILLVAHGDPQALQAALEQRLADGGPWQRLRTSARRGVHVLPPQLFASNPGLGMADAARHLHELATTKAQ
jgi:iron complex transport system substrate-binding protein